MNNIFLANIVQAERRKIKLALFFFRGEAYILDLSQISASRAKKNQARSFFLQRVQKETVNSAAHLSLGQFNIACLQSLVNVGDAMHPYGVLTIEEGSLFNGCGENVISANLFLALSGIFVRKKDL